MGMKGISPVIAAVILIAISVVVGVMLSSWVTHWITERTGSASSCAAYTNYRIDSAKYSSTTKNLTIVVTNLASVKLYGFSIQMQNSTDIVNYNSTNPDIKISPNITKDKPLDEQRSAIIIVNTNGITGNHSSMAVTAEKIRLLNKACPGFAAETSKIERE
jgi:flagellin-like protein